MIATSSVVCLAPATGWCATTSSSQRNATTLTAVHLAVWFEKKSWKDVADCHGQSLLCTTCRLHWLAFPVKSFSVEQKSHFWRFLFLHSGGKFISLSGSHNISFIRFCFTWWKASISGTHSFIHLFTVWEEAFHYSNYATSNQIQLNYFKEELARTFQFEVFVLQLTPFFHELTRSGGNVKGSNCNRQSWPLTARLLVVDRLRFFGNSDPFPGDEAFASDFWISWKMKGKISHILRVAAIISSLAQ